MVLPLIPLQMQAHCLASELNDIHPQLANADMPDVWWEHLHDTWEDKLAELAQLLSRLMGQERGERWMAKHVLPPSW